MAAHHGRIAQLVFLGVMTVVESVGIGIAQLSPLHVHLHLNVLAQLVFLWVMVVVVVDSVVMDSVVVDGKGIGIGQL